MGESGECPSGAHMSHVNVRFAGVLDELVNAIPPPGSEAIQESEGHRRSFKGETTEFKRNRRKRGRDQPRPAVGECGPVALDEMTPRLLKAVASARAAAREASLGKAGFVDRDSQRKRSQSTGHVELLNLQGGDLGTGAAVGRN